LIHKSAFCLAKKDRTCAIDILERLIQGGSQTHRSVCDNAGDAIVAGAVDHATRNNQLVAARPITIAINVDAVVMAGDVCKGAEHGFAWLRKFVPMQIPQGQDIGLRGLWSRAQGVQKRSPLKSSSAGADGSAVAVSRKNKLKVHLQPKASA
jgi:hypothetical protein